MCWVGARSWTRRGSSPPRGRRSASRRACLRDPRHPPRAAPALASIRRTPRTEEAWKRRPRGSLLRAGLTRRGGVAPAAWAQRSRRCWPPRWALQGAQRLRRCTLDAPGRGEMAAEEAVVDMGAAATVWWRMPGCDSEPRWLEAVGSGSNGWRPLQRGGELVFDSVPSCPHDAFSQATRRHSGTTSSQHRRPHPGSRGPEVRGAAAGVPLPRPPHPHRCARACVRPGRELSVRFVGFGFRPRSGPAAPHNNSPHNRRRPRAGGPPPLGQCLLRLRRSCCGSARLALPRC